MGQNRPQKASRPTRNDFWGGNAETIHWRGRIIAIAMNRLGGTEKEGNVTSAIPIRRSGWLDQLARAQGI
jgi:hypothetical protein